MRESVDGFKGWCVRDVCWETDLPAESPVHGQAGQPFRIPINELKGDLDPFTSTGKYYNRH